jgi:hypothetical protein
MEKKKYKVHHFEANGKDLHIKLEQFLNNLEGKVISIIPNIKKGSLAQLYGVTSRVDYLMIVERL